MIEDFIYQILYGISVPLVVLLSIFRQSTRSTWPMTNCANDHP